MAAKGLSKMLSKKLSKKLVADLTIVLVSEKEMQLLNNQYRKKNKPTDVLSFAPVEENSFGELVFCLSILKKQAKRHGLTLKEEFLYLLIHGLLHLLGYDHEINDKRARDMYLLQDKIYEELRYLCR
ncbi:MAG: rRNA maturation RNase YbeY [Bdellovibrionales bacterium RBG_16_40_8]|nr:MAG: rRNA maturation RNase YbeY [Bdellovibrionales bacterium RBG_16_40_8]